MPADRVLPEVYRLTQPLSPHRAAEIDGVALDPACLVPPDVSPLVIELAGGLMVPLRRDLLQIDLVAQLKLPVVLVARTALGTINHTLLSLEALRARGIKIQGVAFVGTANEDNERTIVEMGGVRALGRLPLIESYSGHVDGSLPRKFPVRGFCLMRSPVWHPFTQHALMPPPPIVARAEGAWLETIDGKRILDAISSWWVVTHGHRHPHIVSAIKEQAGQTRSGHFRRSYARTGGDLAAKLVEIAPPRIAACVLLRQRVDIGRSRAEDGAWLLAQHRPAAQTHRRTRAWVSRRHHRHDVCRRARRFQCRLRATVVRCYTIAISAGGTRADHDQRAGEFVPRGADSSADRRAADPRGGRNAYLSAGRAFRDETCLRTVWCAAHRGRGDDGMGAHGDAVRL